MPVAVGSLRPMRPKGFATLLYILFTFLLPLILAPALLPLAVEFALRDRLPGVPLYLILSLALAAGIVVSLVGLVMVVRINARPPGGGGQDR